MDIFNLRRVPGSGDIARSLMPVAGVKKMIEFLGRAFAPVATILSFIADIGDTQESIR